MRNTNQPTNSGEQYVSPPYQQGMKDPAYLEYLAMDVTRNPLMDSKY
jgi:hypothetical protein